MVIFMKINLIIYLNNPTFSKIICRSVCQITQREFGTTSEAKK